MRRVGIQISLEGEYGRGILRGLMQYANVRGDWEFVMPPIFRLTTNQIIDPATTDGVIALVHNSKTITPFRKQKVPLVNVSSSLLPNELTRLRVPTVIPDSTAIARHGFEHLADRGFRNFAFCGHPLAGWSLIRRDVFTKACRERGFACETVAVADGVPSDWIASLPRPCAILAGNDRYAWYVIDVCRNLKISIPDQIAVLGIDNDTFLDEMVRPTLSSVVVPAVQIGFEAGRILDDLMADKPVSMEPVLLPPAGIVTRQSTDVLNIDDDVVADAVRFIRERASKMVNVQDVLDYTLISRRNLERRFRRVLNRSLLNEIRRVHVERAANLLRETDIDMPSIATQCGFSSPVHFSSVFKEFIGVAPSVYRRRHRVGAEN
ncbi:MAG TPA: XylR family transcriptional regulator [Tepidisphaeraceae bacterium]|nr:XylR family transcriptional regulator [Tepidisphaeraceae bacterium]